MTVVKGEWWFWSWCGFWELRLADDPRPINLSSSRRRIEDALSYLDGQRLLAFGVDPNDGTTEMLFDLGASLRFWRADVEREDDDIWALYKPDRRVLLVRGDGRYSHELGTRPQIWKQRAR